MQALMVQMYNNNEAAPIAPRRKKQNPNQLKYHHTHWACNHHGHECQSKVEGQNDEATFQNQVGGSTKDIKA